MEENNIICENVKHRKGKALASEEHFLLNFSSYSLILNPC